MGVPGVFRCVRLSVMVLGLLRSIVWVVVQVGVGFVGFLVSMSRCWFVSMILM